MSSHGLNEQIFGFIEQASERLTDKVIWEKQRTSTFPTTAVAQ
jgi:hypothetical protein